MTIELSEEQKEMFNRILDYHAQKKSEKNMDKKILIEFEMSPIKRDLMRSLGFKNYVTLMKEAAPLFF